MIVFKTTGSSFIRICHLWTDNLAAIGFSYIPFLFRFSYNSHIWAFNGSWKNGCKKMAIITPLPSPKRDIQKYIPKINSTVRIMLNFTIPLIVYENSYSEYNRGTGSRSSDQRTLRCAQIYHRLAWAFWRKILRHWQ